MSDEKFKAIIIDVNIFKKRDFYKSNKYKMTTIEILSHNKKVIHYVL